MRARAARNGRHRQRRRAGLDPTLAESARLYDLPAAEAFAQQQPIERLLDPAEIAAMLVWLAGEHADGVTGALVPVDGSLTV